MKKLLFVFTLLAASFTFIACSDDDDEKTIGMNELPTNAKSFLETHFPGQEANRVEKDNDGYDVYLKNGFSIDFTLDGEWDDVDGNTQDLPQSIIDLLPAKIAEYIQTNYLDETIREINKEKFGFEVDLSNRVELEFDSEGNFLRVDK